MKTCVCFLIAFFSVGLKSPSASDPESTTPFNVAVIQLRPEDMQWEEGPPTVPAGVKVAILEGDPKKQGPFTMRIKMPAGYKIPLHVHPADERVTVLQGDYCIAIGERSKENVGNCFSQGSFVITPSNTWHTIWTKKGAIVQVNGVGPWGIDYE